MMDRTKRTRLLAASVIFASVSAQQFVDTTLDVNYPGLSTACITALNTTVHCPALLADASIDNYYLTEDQLSALCVDDCKASLNAVRATIQQACTADSDVIVDAGIAYPASWIIDNFIYTHQISCLTDSTTGEYCDTLIQSWANITKQSSNQSCSDCMLSMQQVMLESVIGYDDELAESFASTTSSCGNTNYPFTSPTPYALNATKSTQTPSTTSTTAPTENTSSTGTCTDTYTVLEGDTCLSISAAYNVSSFYLAYNNNLDIYCSDLTVGKTLCLPGACDIYTVQINDTCLDIVEAVSDDITVTQLQSWNPNINLLCGNLGNLNGTYICVSPVGGWLDTTSDSSSTATTAVPAPTNVANGTNTDCAKYYTVQDGDYCSSITVQEGISLSDFYFLNPEVDEDCTNLVLGSAYCVSAVGDISLYANYTGGRTTTNSCSSPSAPANCYLDVSNFPDAPSLLGNITFPRYNRTSVTKTISTATPLPTASGTVAGCLKYLNYQSLNSTIPDADQIANSCWFVANLNDVSVADLVSWNPSLTSNVTDCSLQPGYSYCIVSGSLTTTSAASRESSSSCLDVSEKEVVEGTTPACTCYTAVQFWDADGYDCEAIVADFGLTVTQLVTFNTWLEGNCTLNLYANLAKDVNRAVCVRGQGPSSTIATSSTASIPITSSLSPTQTGTTPSCSRYHTIQSGDSCDRIESIYSATFAQLYDWNPVIGDNCQSLQVGYAICVGVQVPLSITGSSLAVSTSSSPSPTQSGTISSCTRYYTIQSGDGCTAIESRYGLSFTQLYAWNPAIGDNCQSLQVGYAICVAIDTPTPAAPTQTGITTACTNYYTVQLGDGCAAIESTYSIAFSQLYSWNPAIGDDCQYLVVGDAICVGVGPTPGGTTTSPATPTQTSATSSACSRYYTVAAGDSCAGIESQFGITFAQFYSWNPDVGSNCQFLDVGNEYCVVGPTQSGMASNCETFYTAIDGDSCWSIQQEYGISAKDFLTWNPAVGSDCGGLWVGESYCVGV
ncbi:hypothetical protein BP00DRAFT_386649 [Aspergillus indologenus CBS 114.80]|uniref:LysM domain-containing protein n=1 Tax=Aspergillus indologenus CBS 114.80 TaxID=1450541 RepID=A0A2V5IQ42_9EURO|nr:hypothetical protein BP00DRAFT_386649 [Aspergillus indologenus CBS 114.80]